MGNPEHTARLKEGGAAWCTWRWVNLEVRPHLSWADLTGADLRGANLTGAKLIGADLSEADLSEADLSEADLSEANLNRADLIGADLRVAKLNRADLTGADLNRANLGRANLRGANLSVANLTGANLFGANLNRANLTGADFTGANLTGVKLYRTVIDEITKEGLHDSNLLFDEELDLKRGLLLASTEEGRSITLGISERAILEVSIADKEILLLVQEHILNAAGQLMEAMGYELEAEEEPKYGSFFQQLRYKLSELITPEDVSKLAEEAKEGLRAQINKTPIQATATLTSATAELITSLEKVDNAAIRLGTLIVVKTTIDGVTKVRIEDISITLAHKLRDEPTFLESPVAVAHFLDEEKKEEVA